ncbi:MAG: flagellar hook-associated protein FlgK [Ignavibacteriales bacterium]|nr:flagellar hook-associated protein FlgK [Ignavibacteriales bacterium]
MTSGFYGILNSHRALMLNQAAINLINSNIANMNTPGYSKQRLEIEQKAIITPEITPYYASQANVGPIIQDISRNRDEYLDNYFRKEDSTFNYYKELSENALLIEDITNELGDTGIIAAFNEFYNAAHQISVNPTDSIARNNFVQKALDLTGKLNISYNRLSELRENLVGDYTDATTLETSKIKIATVDLNAKLASIAELNHSIAITTAQGTSPNALLDQRDRLIDQIGEYIPIKIKEGANNLVTISLGGIDIVKGASQVGFFDVVSGDINNPAIVRINDETGTPISTNANSLITSGKMAGILEIGGSNPNKLNIYGVMEQLNTLAREFAREVNTIHLNGQYLDSSSIPYQLTPVTVATPPPDPFDIFVQNRSLTQVDYSNLTAGNITISENIINDPYKIAAASGSSAANETGDGKNALLMAQLRNSKLSSLNAATTEGFINTVVGKIGIQAKTIYDSQETQGAIMQQLTQRRESAIGVNLDEELADLIKYQRSFEASARILNITNEIIQQIIALAK